MDEEMIERLLALNNAFYTAFADQFANSRSVSDPALTSILPYLPSRARILDVGCGNGRLARLLERERSGCTYVGVDAIPDLIEEARDQAGALRKTETSFLLLDVTEEDWVEEIPAPRGGDAGGLGYDCAVALAVLHHIPGLELRARVLRDTASLLAPAGYLVISTWRFLAHERMRRKLVDWSAVDIDEGRLDPGDYLLDWKRGGRGLRYCHMVDEEELETLAAMSGLEVRETFRAGGREGDLSLFAVLDLRG